MIFCGSAEFTQDLIRPRLAAPIDHSGTAVPPIGLSRREDPAPSAACCHACLIIGALFCDRRNDCFYGSNSPIPARPGDTIRLEARALDKFIRRERLFVVHDNVFFNQHGQVICSGRGQTIRPI